MKRILLYHPFGNQNVRSVLDGLLNKGILQSFHTTIAFFPNTFFFKTLSFLGLKKFLGRMYDKKMEKKTFCYPWKEILRLSGLSSKLRLNISSGKINIQLNKKVSKYVDKHYNDIIGVFCYTHGALDIFRVCKKYNKLCFYDLPIAYYKEILDIIQIERNENPYWVNDIHIYKDTQSLYIIDEELKLADCIFVASSYVKNSLIKYGYKSDCIYAVPYGFPSVVPKEYRIIKNKLKILYVGGLHQLKGLSYMFEAVDTLREKIELSIIGSGNIENSLLKNNIKKHKYLGSLLHSEVLKEMHNCDILLFPTLSDGFGLVVTEAMSQGTPVIMTDHCGAADLVEDGINGWIIESRSSQSIERKLVSILEHPEVIEKVGRNALETASRRSWDNYNQDIYSIIKKYI